MELFNTDDTDDRGQVGIGTLIVFIAMVLVAAIAAGVLVNTAGFLQEKSQQTGEESTSQVSDGIRVVTTHGEVQQSAGGSNYVVNVSMVVKRTAGADAVDLDDATIQAIGDNGETTMVHTSTTSAGASEPNNADEPLSGEFGLREIDTSQFSTDGNGAETVLESDDQRLALEVNLDAGDLGSGGTKETTTTADDWLASGEEVTLKITAGSGASTTVVVNVPSSIDSVSSGAYVEV